MTSPLFIISLLVFAASVVTAEDQSGMVFDLGDAILIEGKSASSPTDSRLVIKTLLAPKRELAIAIRYDASGPVFYFSSNGIMVALSDVEVARKALLLVYPSLKDTKIFSRITSVDGLGAAKQDTP